MHTTASREDAVFSKTAEHRSKTLYAHGGVLFILYIFILTVGQETWCYLRLLATFELIYCTFL